MLDLNNHWRYVVGLVDCAVAKLCAYTVNAVEHLVLALLSYVAVCLVLYRLLNRGHGLRYESGFKQARRVLFVTAHPDDECMFFGPTIYKLTQEARCQVYVLCLSTGDKDGQGQVRVEELWRACEVLGVPASHICVYKCTVLPDDPTVRWREDVIAQLVLQHVESLDIDTLVTFDKHGVSRHPNHCSIYYAVAYLSMEKRLPARCKVYTLESINVLRKYWLVFDMPMSFVLSTHRYILRWTQRDKIIDAMRRHTSQYVWFRKLYVRFSRYMLINTYQQLDMIDLELDLTIDD